MTDVSDACTKTERNRMLQLRSVVKTLNETEIGLDSHKKVKGCAQLFMENPPQSYGASPAIWNHTVSPATRHR